MEKPRIAAAFSTSSSASLKMRSLDDLAALRLTRREALVLGLGALGTLVPSRAMAAKPRIGFDSIPIAMGDETGIARGYASRVLFAWGDPVSRGPAFRMDASNSAADQAMQAGMHHDGMQFFPLPHGTNNAAHGLLAINHEYLAQSLLFSDGMATWTADKFRKAGNGVGVSIIEVRRRGAAWEVVRPSRFARRLTLFTPMHLGGPARGDVQLRTATDPRGEVVIGTFANCACGFTPWGTYLSCEENFHSWFVKPSGNRTERQAAFNLPRHNSHRWHEIDQRFDVDRHPNEFNRFGWVVEIDPYDPKSVPVKRTALGRFNRESAFTHLATDGRVVAYSGDDERFECIYKFVTRDKFDAENRAANRHLFDHGTLYVARFFEDGKGEWLPLVQGETGLLASDGFETQADVVIHTRLAARSVGATPMDRPEWIAIHPQTGEAFVSLTNNHRRGEAGFPGADAANPRINNLSGHIVRWRESGGDAAATTFDWDVFVLGGKDDRQAGQSGDDFACPDTLRVAPNGLLWIGTDGANSVGLGNDALLAADPATGEVRRFFTGPRGSEITGLTFTPDGRTAFVNVQHPGAGVETSPDYLPWPSLTRGDRPRSATVVITKDDGGVIGE
jgi:secreted PhoX family phosphatase